MSSLDYQVGGNHYMIYPMQPIELIKKMKFIEGCIIKYALRKKSNEDLDKILQYVIFKEDLCVKGNFLFNTLSFPIRLFDSIINYFRVLKFIKINKDQMDDFKTQILIATVLEDWKTIKDIVNEKKESKIKKLKKEIKDGESEIIND